MITLKDSIEIKTTPEKIYNWFMNMDNKRFTEWHPNHKKFVRVTGGMDEGDIIYFEECVSGVWYKVKCKITGIEKSKRGWKAEFKSLSGIGKIAFMAEKIEDACIFTHIESFGSKKPVIGNCEPA